MNWSDISHLYGKKFRRATGIHRSVYEEMVACVQDYRTSKRKHPTQGGTSTISIENQVLITVLYWREYRSQENLALEYRLSQSYISRLICGIEHILIQSGHYSIPGKKALRNENGLYEVIITDVMESPTERPKKNKNASIVAKKSDIL